MIMPCIELNTPHKLVSETSSYADAPIQNVTQAMYAAIGLADWQHVTDTAIITARPNAFIPKIDGGWYDGGLVEQMKWLIPDGMRIIWGIAPAGMEWWDVEAWRKLIPIIQSLPGPVLLELESSFKAGDIIPTDFQKVMAWVEMLKELPGELWFNFPRIMPDTELFPYRELLTGAVLVQVIKTLPGASFLDASVAYIQRDNWTRDKMVYDVGENSLIDRLLVAPNDEPVVLGGKNYYSTTGAIAEAATREPREQIVYTDFVRWTKVATEWRAGV